MALIPRAPPKRWVPLDARDPDGLGAWALRFFEALRVRNFSSATVFNREVSLRVFLPWCEARGLTRPAQITRPILQSFQRHLYLYRKRNGEPLSFRSQLNHLLAVRAWFQWMTRQNLLLYNPACDLDLPRVGKRLPQHVLTPAEAELILALPDLEDPLGLRDRAMLEVLYSTGLRRLELIHLHIFDLDPRRGTVSVRQGKGKKDRVVPIGERALGWTQKYLGEVRPGLVVEPDEAWLFLSPHGEALTPKGLTKVVQRYVRRSGLGKPGACHLWRHSMATAMLENGADIRYIQEMLGHAELGTTAIYTKVSIVKLKEIHTATHPSSRPVPGAAPSTQVEEGRVAPLEPLVEEDDPDAADAAAELEDLADPDEPEELGKGTP